MPPGHPRWSATGWVWLARVGYTPPATYCIGADDYGRRDACTSVCGYRFECAEVAAELDADLSDALRTRFDLTHAIVFTSPAQGPGGEGPAPVTHRLGAVAADLLTEIVTEGDVLGLVWGPEIEAMCPELTALPRCSRPRHRVPHLRPTAPA